MHIYIHIVKMSGEQKMDSEANGANTEQTDSVGVVITGLIETVNNNITNMKSIIKELTVLQKKVSKIEKGSGTRKIKKNSDSTKSTSFQQKYVVSKSMMNFINLEPELLQNILGSPSPITKENGIARGEFSKFLSLYNKKYNLVGKKEDGTPTGAVILDTTDKTGPISTEAGKRLFNLFIFPEKDGKPDIPDKIVWKNIQKFISKHYISIIGKTESNQSPEPTESKPADSSESIKDRMKKRSLRGNTTKVVSN